MKYTTIACLLLINAQTYSQKDPYLIIGTYTSGKSKGIQVYRFHESNGRMDSIGETTTSNPSFLAFSPDKKFVYAVNEDANDKTSGLGGGAVSAFAFDKNKGTLTPVNKSASGGKHPCHVTVDPTGRWVIAGNYTSGSIGVLPINKDGGVEAPIQIIQHQGKGPNTKRQEGPHVHSTLFTKDGMKLLVPDLGSDKVFIYNWDAKIGRLSAFQQPALVSQPGSGPRHMDLHPTLPMAYLMEELSGTVVAYKIGKTSINAIQRISAIDLKDSLTNFSADIHVSPDGKFLYCTNRGGTNTITTFAIDPKNGLLKWVESISSGGKIPRNFSIDPSGNYLLIANQETDNVVVFKRNKTTGKLTQTEIQIKVGNPVCLKWIE